MDDLDVARRVAALVLLAEPAERDDVMQTEIPLDRFARVLALMPGVLASYVDSITARDRRHRLAVEGVLRTFLQETK
ncbi:hypothetical protein ACNPM4_06540 [Microbacterium sp. AGC62]